MKTLTVKMPAFLASALANGDTSGLECSCGAVLSELGRDMPDPHTGDCDFRWLQAALAYCAPGHVVDVGETHTSRLCDLPGCTGDQHEVADYVVLYPDTSEVNP